MTQSNGGMTREELQRELDESTDDIKAAAQALRNAYEARAIIRWTVTEIYGLKITEGGEIIDD